MNKQNASAVHFTVHHGGLLSLWGAKSDLLTPAEWALQPHVSSAEAPKHQAEVWTVILLHLVVQIFTDSYTLKSLVCMLFDHRTKFYYQCKNNEQKKWAAISCVPVSPAPLILATNGFAESYAAFFFEVLFPLFSLFSGINSITWIYFILVQIIFFLGLILTMAKLLFCCSYIVTL